MLRPCACASLRRRLVSPPAAAAFSSSAAAPATAAKVTTGLVGLDVVPDARAVLQRLYAKILVDVAAVIPEGVPYRVSVEATTRERAAAVDAHEEVRDRERARARGGCGRAVAPP